MSLLGTILRDEIQHNPAAWISFGRFMSQSLYHPEHGYYAKPGAECQVGRRGDFMTSVSVGALFGRLLARQIAFWWKQLGSPKVFCIVEAGGLDGCLARDLLTSLAKESPECLTTVCYTLVEPLPHLKAAQQKTLAGMDRVKWVASLRAMTPFVGVILGNELLDAFPVQVFCQDHAGCVEWGVGLKEDSFAWKPAATRCQLEGVPSGYHGQVETCPSAITWLRDAAHVLHRGQLLLLDYGWTDEEYFQVSRPEGTLRGYRHHQYVESILADPGDQDLTAHVRWTPLREGASRLGLREVDFIEQGRWLTRIMAREPVLTLDPKEIRQFQTLTHPSMLGSPFRVLTLAKESL